MLQGPSRLNFSLSTPPSPERHPHQNPLDGFPLMPEAVQPLPDSPQAEDRFQFTSNEDDPYYNPWDLNDDFLANHLTHAAKADDFESLFQEPLTDSPKPQP